MKPDTNEERITAKDFLEWSKQDSQGKDKRARSNRLSNLKKALDTQLNKILRDHKLINETNLPFPARLDKVKKLGYTTCISFKHLNRLRVLLEHKNSAPSADLDPYSGSVELFIELTDNKMAERKKIENLAFKEQIEKFEKLLREKSRKPDTIKAYAHSLKSFQKFADKRLSDVKEADLAEYMDYLKKTDRNSAGSIAKKSLIIFFNEVFNKNYRIEQTFPRDIGRNFETLTTNQVIQLFEIIRDPKYRLIIGLIYGSGLKSGSVLDLKVGDIKFNKKVNVIERTGVKSKIKRYQYIIIAKKIRDELKEYSNKLQSCSKHKRRKYFEITPRALQKMLQKYGVEMGIELTARILRNTFEKNLHEQKIDFRIIQTLLGKYSIIWTCDYEIPSILELEKVSSPLDDIL
ncbi:MAG: tyrosine-type recombinase/integrase [bacterium]|nr:tyrosine-type recombinase/integrase [bacterium]